MDKSVDVVVVGAGIAGLVAARDLVRGGVDVLVLEARDRVGGRLLNGELPGGAPIEVGGQWVGPGQHRILALLAELRLDTYPTHTAGRNIAEIGSARSEYTGRIPKLNPLALADVAQAQWRLDRIARRVAAGEPWLAAEAETLDGQTFATWLRRTARTPGGRSFFRIITEAVFSAEPEDMSALWAAFYVGAAGGLDALISTAGGAQQDRVVGGSQTIAAVLAEGLGERIVLGAPVRDIEWDAAGVRVRAGRTVVRARRAVVAVPPPLAARIRFTPGLPGDRDQLAQRMPMGRVIKVNVAYDEPFWRRAGFSGQANSDRRALGTVFDNTPRDGAPGVLVGFLEGRHADTAARLDLADRRARVIDDLVGYFGPRARTPIDYLERDWAEEEFSRGCYGAFTPPGVLTRFGPALRAPIGPLHWAGTETATRWAGYMDGAAESGHRAAREAAAALAAASRVTA
ncbi:FAD-dependent oxidoreductase [Nocardia otitidiscaviarum]|uniref:flavin monoamine oxidase family protein n=1 Tax=Nocardia otitidiscaviarum TaxID=1823 RepID=UPI0004A6FB30|nr:FAD-dependent oxidoreductase [Nocardia otitidiscaviarum]MBF6132598.1 FAD-dependent oxidoreductase [Nocardia otitidiscaviarum]MBF6488699.1 FAD-dependent oxidoreductase [Nocardia otitidiscaviarum]